MEEIKKPKKKKLGSYPQATVIFSTTLSLFVLGLFGLLLIHAQSLSQAIKSNVEIHVYLAGFTTEAERIKIEKILEQKPYIQKEENKKSIYFLSKDEAAKKYLKGDDDFIEILGENPLKDALIIKVDPEYAETDKLQSIKKEIQDIYGVFEVDLTEQFVDKINKNLTRISLILVAFAVILFFIVMILVNNTIKLALFSQRFLIRSMQLVGATSAFIRRPFLKKSIVQGVLSGVLASAVLALVTRYAYNKIENLELLFNPKAVLILFIALLIIGALIAWFSTFRAIRKYLGMSLDDLY